MGRPVPGSSKYDMIAAGPGQIDQRHSLPCVTPAASDGDGDGDGDGDSGGDILSQLTELNAE